MAQFTTIKPRFDTNDSSRVRLAQKGILSCHDRFGSLSNISNYIPINKLKKKFYCASRTHSSPTSTSSVYGITGLNTESSMEIVEEGDDGGVYEVLYDDNFEFHKDGLDYFRGLVLDVSYRPINVVCWRRAICLEFLEKADVLEYYDQTVNSPSGSFYIPAVLRIPHMLTVIKKRRVKSTLSRRNILYRDNYTCQYCSSTENLTIDHVLPIARGGEWKWENLVTACSRCNSRKGQKTMEEANMKLMKDPKPPKDFDIVAIPLTNRAIQTLRMREGTPEEWHQYLSMPSGEL